MQLKEVHQIDIKDSQLLKEPVQRSWKWPIKENRVMSIMKSLKKRMQGSEVSKDRLLQEELGHKLSKDMLSPVNLRSKTKRQRKVMRSILFT